MNLLAWVGLAGFIAGFGYLLYITTPEKPSVEKQQVTHLTELDKGQIRIYEPGPGVRCWVFTYDRGGGISCLPKGN